MGNSALQVVPRNAQRCTRSAPCVEIRALTTLTRISIIVPAHNAEAHLAACLEAIAASDVDRCDFEVIVVDDASNDSTSEVGRRGADRVISTSPRPRGPAHARNVGARIAQGQFLVFVDSDVVLHSGALGRMVSTLETDESLVAAFGSYDDDPVSDGLVSRYRNLLHHFAHHESAGRVATFWAGCGIVRASAFAASGGFDDSRYPRPQIEDIELGYRLNQLGGILLDPGIQCSHRKHWTLRSVLTTDFRDRAVPWVRLLLSREKVEGSATPSLGAGALASSASAASAVLAALIAFFLSSPVWGLVAGSLAFLSISLGWRFYAFLQRTGGFALAATGVVLHFAYQLESAAAVPVGLFLYLARDRAAARERSAKGAAGSRFVPLAFGETGARVVAFLTTAYLARTLGASGFGVIGFALAVVAHFGTALSAGIGEVGARDVAREPERAQAIIATATTLRLIIALAAIVAIFAITSILHIDPLTRQVTWLYSLTVIPLAIDSGWAYKGLGRTRPVGAALFLGQALVLALVLVTVQSDDHVVRVPLVQVTGDLIAALFLTVPLMRGGWTVSRMRAVGDFARRTGTITASRVLRTVVVSFDVVLLGLMVTTREVGLYSAAYRIIFFVMAIVYASHIAFLPDVARSETEPRALSRLFSEATGLALTVTVPFVVGGILVAPSLMVLIFGAEFRGGAIALQLLLSALLLFAIHGASRNVFIAIERLGLETMVVAAGVVTNVAANLILIPRFGIAGAAVATILGEAVILTGLLYVLYRNQIRMSLVPSLAPLISGAVMGLALFLFGVGRPAWQTIPLGAITYTLVLGTFSVLMRHHSPSLVPETR